MALESLIDAYGYWAILIGTFFEGETILVLGGLASHLGYLRLPWVIMFAFIGTLCGDQLYFYLGRRHSQTILAKRPSWKARIDKAQNLWEHYRTPLILAFRFLYGLRTVLPFVIGMSTVPTRQFIIFNAAGALVWAVIVGTGGYFFGNALEVFLGNIKHYEHEIFGVIIAAGIMIWILYFYRRRKNQAFPFKSSESSQ